LSKAKSLWGRFAVNQGIMPPCWVAVAGLLEDRRLFFSGTSLSDSPWHFRYFKLLLKLEAAREAIKAASLAVLSATQI
jgi:hypothetical protein